MVTMNTQERGALQSYPVPEKWHYWSCDCGQSSEAHDDLIECAAEASEHQRTCGGTLC